MLRYSLFLGYLSAKLIGFGLNLPVYRTGSYCYISKFDWSSSQLLGFKAVTALCSACGQFLLFPVMMKVLGMNINIVGMMTVTSRVGHYLLLALAPAHSDWLIYVSALVNCLQGVQVNQYDYDKDLVLTPNL